MDRKLPENPSVWGISGILDHPKPTSHELVGFKNRTYVFCARHIPRWWFHIFFNVHSSYLGKISNSTSIFFRWFETNNQILLMLQNFGEKTT